MIGKPHSGLSRRAGGRGVCWKVRLQPRRGRSDMEHLESRFADMERREKCGSAGAAREGGRSVGGRFQRSGAGAQGAQRRAEKWGEVKENVNSRGRAGGMSGDGGSGGNEGVFRAEKEKSGLTGGGGEAKMGATFGKSRRQKRHRAGRRWNSGNGFLPECRFDLKPAHDTEAKHGQRKQRKGCGNL